MRRNIHSQKGFTLVELAIVMTIIGLLIGGILKGQELMMNARITATVAQVKSYSAAVTTFKDMYQATPGDMLNAGTRLVGCPPAGTGVGCNPKVTGTANADAGDGIVGDGAWSTGGTFAAPTTTKTGGTGGAGDVSGETYLFWSHLLLANLIGGITTDGLNTATPFAFDVTQPSAKIGGGFIVGYDTGVVPKMVTFQPANTGLSGTILAQVSDPKAALPSVSGQMPLAPLRAAQIDRKMDDGRPATGYVQAYGIDASCFTLATSLVYNETVNLSDCGLLYRIEN
jgi:prepilin-type N-terminal cleavage/methylation domain-containing protein